VMVQMLQYVYSNATKAYNDNGSWYTLRIVFLSLPADVDRTVVCSIRDRQLIA